MSCLDQFGIHVRSLTVLVDQQQESNRLNAARTLYKIAEFRSLQRLKVQFVGFENPLFYNGADFIKALILLFGAVGNPVNSDSEANTPLNRSRSNSVEDKDVTVSNSDAADDIDPDCLPEKRAKRQESNNDDVGSMSDTSSIYFDENYFSPTRIKEGQLREVDLSGLKVGFDDRVVSLLARYHDKLEKLNIQNRIIVVKVTSECVFDVIKRCRKLRELHCNVWHIHEEALNCLMEDDRAPLEHLSLFGSRFEKYCKPLEGGVWGKVAKKLPSLRVSLCFDHHCPQHRIHEVMQPDVPVSVLYLETQTPLLDELQVVGNFYGKTLEKLVVRAIPPRIGPTIDGSLLVVAENCRLLSALHVFCVLQTETVERILELHPQLEKSGAFTLKDKKEPHPWVAGRAARVPQNLG